MSLKEYNDCNAMITSIYTNTCMPCMQTPSFFKGKCKMCETMVKYIALQETKKQLEGG